MISDPKLIDSSLAVHYLNSQTSQVDYSNFVGTKILVAGASGQLGIWMTLYLASVLDDPQLFQLEIETSHPKVTFSALKQCEVKYQPVVRQNNLEKYDFIFDFGLPKSMTNSMDVALKPQEFIGRYEYYRDALTSSGMLIIPSSGAVYGDTSLQPGGFSEVDLNLEETRSPYGEAKLAVERMAARDLGYHAPIMRIFSTFGPFSRVSSPLIGNQFFVQAKNGKISLKGHGLAMRNMTFVGDITKQIIQLSFNESARKMPTNLGSHNTLSVRSFCELVAKQLSADIEFGNQVEKEDYYFPNLNRLNTLIHNDSLPVEEAISITSCYY